MYTKARIKLGNSRGICSFILGLFFLNVKCIRLEHKIEHIGTRTKTLGKNLNHRIKVLPGFENTFLLSLALLLHFIST